MFLMKRLFLFLCMVAYLSTGVPARSAGAGKIVFTTDRDSGFGVYVMDANGKNVRRLADDSVAEGTTSWSPTSNTIAFVSRRDGIPQIYLVGADGSNARRLTRSKTQDLYPNWSPDGREIVYTAGGSGGEDYRAGGQR